MCADAGVKTDAIDDGLGVEAFHLGVGVELVEIADTQRQIGIGKKFDGLCLGETHEEGVNAFLDGSLLQQGGKGMGGLNESRVAHVGADDDARGVEVIVERTALTQKLW